MPLKPSKPKAQIQWDALTMRIDAQLKVRLEKCADLTGIRKCALAALAIEALVEALERDGYLQLPLRMTVNGPPGNGLPFPG